MEGHTTYRVRVDRPWSTKERWGFAQKVLVERKALDEAVELIARAEEQLSWTRTKLNHLGISTPMAEEALKAIQQWRDGGK